MNAVNRKNLKAGFTLIEMVVVVAIIALVTALAVMKLSGLRTDMKVKANIANLKRIDSAVENYLVANLGKGLNRLDLLMKYDQPAKMGSRGSASFDDIEVPPSYMESSLLSDTNTGLHTNLTTITTQYGTTFSPLLGTYHLSTADAKALRETFGLQYGMEGTDGNRQRTGADGAWAQGKTTDPDTCQCVARLLTNGVSVAVVNPYSVSSDIQPSGCAIYNACGQKIWFGTDMKLHMDGDATSYGTSEDAIKALYATGKGGILLAFGLGSYASMIGENVAGLDAAPVCPDIESGAYRRYILLIRLKQTVQNGVEAEYAGVIDPRGRTLAALQSRITK